jgi:hypothetical protein
MTYKENNFSSKNAVHILMPHKDLDGINEIPPVSIIIICGYCIQANSVWQKDIDTERSSSI